VSFPERPLSPQEPITCDKCFDDDGCVDGYTFGWGESFSLVVEPCPHPCHEAESLAPADWVMIEFSVRLGDTWMPWQRMDEFKPAWMGANSHVRFRAVKR